MSTVKRFNLFIRFCVVNRYSPKRIKYLRNLKNFTQKYLGQLIGLPEKNADIRIAQYESDSRTPKADITKELAKALTDKYVY